MMTICHQVNLKLLKVRQSDIVDNDDIDGISSEDDGDDDDEQEPVAISEWNNIINSGVHNISGNKVLQNR